MSTARSWGNWSAVIMCAAGVAFQTCASDRVWTGGGGSANWSVTGNWSGSTPPSTNDRPVFAGVAGLATTNDFVWNVPYSGLLFSDTAGAFTVGGNPVVLGGDITNLSVNAQTVGLAMTLNTDRVVSATAGNITVSGQFSGTGGVIKAGANTLVLAGPNSYQGLTRIDAGTLAVTTAVPVALERVGLPALWFDATDTGTLTTNTSGRVTAWVNKGSMSGMNAGVPSSFTGPLLVSSTYAGGRQMLRLDGNSQGLVTAGNTGISGTANRTLFFAGYRAAGNVLLIDIGSPANAQSFGISDQADLLYWYAYGSGMDITRAATPGNELHVCSFITGIGGVASARNAYYDGSYVSALSSTLATVNTPLYLGYRSNNTTTRGDIGEVIIYTRTLSDSERADVENYLLAKWKGAVRTVVSSLPQNTGVTLASGTTLRVDAGAPLVSAMNGPSDASVALASGTSLTVSNSAASVFAGTVSGGGSVIKRGNQTLTLSGASTFTGVTAVHGGSLIVNALPSGGVASPIGASSANSTNLVLGAGTLKYIGGDALSDRGLLIASEVASRASLMWVTNAVTISGPVRCTTGSFIKTGPGTLTLSGASENIFSSNATYNGTAELNPGANGDGPTQGFSGLNVAEGKLVLGVAGQTNRFAGELYVGIRQAAAKAAELEIDGGVTTGTTWMAVGRGDGTNGLSSRITVNGGQLNVLSFSMGYNAGLTGFYSFPVLQVNGGSVSVSSPFYVGESSGATATINVVNGRLRSSSNIQLSVSAGSAGTLNLSGGTVEANNLTRGSGAANVLFDGGVLRSLVAGQTLQSLTLASVGAGGARFDTSLADYTVAQNLLHLSGLGGADGGLVKMGNGTLTFSSTNSTFSGPTVVSNGTLKLTGSLPGGSAVTVASSGAFQFARTGATNDMGNVTLLAGGTFAPPVASILWLNISSLAAQAGSVILLTNGTAQAVAVPGALALGAVGADPVTLTLDVPADGTPCDCLRTTGTLSQGRVNVNLRRMGSVFPYALNGTVRLIAFPSAQTPDLSGLALVAGAGGKTNSFSIVADDADPNVSWVAVTVANDYANATIWTNTGAGNWSVSGNWSIPPSGLAGSSVRFDSAITAASQVTLDSAATVGAVYFNNTNAYTLAGAGSLALDNSGARARVAVERGAHAISTPIAVAAGLDVEAATNSQLTLAGDVSGSGSLRLTDAGTVLLTGANLTGATEVRNGTLKINAASVLGGGSAAVTLDGGKLETTGSMTLAGDSQAPISTGPAGGTVIQPTNAVLTLGGSLSGTGRLTLENGTVQPGGGGSTPTVAAFGMNNLTFSNITGSTIILTQPVQLGGTLAVAASPADVTFSGAISQSSGKGATVLTKRGTGTLTVNGTGATYNWSSAGSPSSVAVEQGALRFPAGATNSIDTDNGTALTLSVGTAAGKQGVLRVETGASLTLRNDLRVGAAAGATGIVEIAGGTVYTGWLNIAPTNNQNGVVRISDGGSLSLIRNAAEVGFAGYNSADTGAYAYLSVQNSGALVTTNGSGQNFQVGRYGTARMDVDGGSVYCRGWTCAGRFPTGYGELNIRNGGLIEHGYENTGSGAFGLAEQGKGVVNVLTGGVLRARYNLFLSLNNVGTQRTVLNLWNGGVVEPNRLTPSASGSIVSNSVNFHGGVLRAYATNTTDFLNLRLVTSDTGRAYVWPEGAILDSNGKDVTVAEPLLAPTGQGVASVAVTSGGRYLAPPALWVSGGNGVGATASSVLDENGAITNVFISNPGVGYTATPNLSVLGGVPSTAAVIGAITCRDNASGGLKKQGVGVVTLTGVGSTYTGETTVVGGTLKVAAGLLTGTAGYRTAANAVFDLSGTAHTVGLLAGAGVVSNGSVTVTNRLELGDASATVGTLSVVGNVTLAAQSGLVFDYTATTQDKLAVTGNLTIGNRGWVNFGRTESNPMVTPFERLAMTFTGTCTNNAASGGWRVLNSGRPSALLVASFETRGNEVYLKVRYAGTLMLIK